MTAHQQLRHRVPVALIVSFLGTTVLYVIMKLLEGLLGTSDLFWCGVGAFLTSLMWANPARRGFRANLWPAAGITFGTFAFISFGHAVHQVAVRHVPVGFEPIGKFIWATLITSWWLIPMTAIVLAILNKLFQAESSGFSRR